MFHSRLRLPLVVVPQLTVSLSLALVATLAGCSSAKKGMPMGMMGGPVAVRTVTATKANVPLEISAIGNVEALASVDVRSRVVGQIEKVHFQEGQDVHAGDLLFELDQRPFLQAIHENEANLARDVALAAQYRANVLKDEAQLKSAQAQSDRAEALLKEGINSREQTDTAVANAQSLVASREADQAAVTSAEASARADRAKLEDAKLQLSYTAIRAPMSGRAGAILVKPGNLVKENDTILVTLLQIEPVFVSFSVPEQQLAQFRSYGAQHPLEVTAVPSGGTSETGALRFIDNTVDATTGTIKLKAMFQNKKRQLWPGQFVDVRANLSTEADRVVVPTQTVQTGPNGRYVWVVGSEAKVAMRNVNVLRTWGSNSVIGSGLEAGEVVISEGQMRLMPGATVQVLKPQSAKSNPLAANAAGM